MIQFCFCFLFCAQALLLNGDGASLMQMRSTLLPGQPWDVMVDLFFYREPEETKEPGEEDAADYGAGDQGYSALPAPGGQSPFPYLPFSMPINNSVG